MEQPILFAFTLATTEIFIAYPDALGLATPTVVAVATGIAALNALLLKGVAKELRK